MVKSKYESKVEVLAHVDRGLATHLGLTRKQAEDVEHLREETRRFFVAGNHKEAKRCAGLAMAIIKGQVPVKE